jgi:PadR family transcriptional regulator PadR
MQDMKALLDSFVIELKRGTLTLAVLSQLKAPHYGYSLVQTMEEKDASIEPGTLYPLLRRLEKQGLLTSKWDTKENRARKYYVLSKSGTEALVLLRKEWENIARHMSALLKGED